MQRGSAVVPLLRSLSKRGGRGDRGETEGGGEERGGEEVREKRKKKRREEEGGEGGEGRKEANPAHLTGCEHIQCSTRCTLSVCVSYLHGWGVHEVKGKEVVDTHSLQ